MGKDVFRYCGRSFTKDELVTIHQIIAAVDRPNRAEIARRVCRQLSWLRPNGQLKAMSCRVALLKMHRDGLLKLPVPINGNGNGRWLRHHMVHQAEVAFTKPLKQLVPLNVEVVASPTQSKFWNNLMACHHYLGYVPLPGAQVRYLIYSQDQQLLAALGFGAAAWKIADRDNWIGWDAEIRSRNLNYIVNNNRFLILPHVNVPNLASKILAIIASRIADDWRERYGYPVVLMETFVQCDRFKGTCYRAANWLAIGKTSGRGKMDRYRKYQLPIKDIYIYPLTKEWKEKLLKASSPNHA